MCEVTESCQTTGIYWVQTNLPAVVADVREGEHGIKPDRNIVSCGRHLPQAVRRIRQCGQEAINRIVGNYHTGWKGVTVKVRDGKVWR